MKKRKKIMQKKKKRIKKNKYFDKNYLNIK